MSLSPGLLLARERSRPDLVRIQRIPHELDAMTRPVRCLGQPLLESERVFEIAFQTEAMKLEIGPVGNRAQTVSFTHLTLPTIAKV